MIAVSPPFFSDEVSAHPPICPPEQVPNAPVVAAYGAAGAIALSLVDGAVNLPLLNILIGVPVQILGLFTVREQPTANAPRQPCCTFPQNLPVRHSQLS